jgi:hypothetical protein
MRDVAVMQAGTQNSADGRRKNARRKWTTLKEKGPDFSGPKLKQRLKPGRNRAIELVSLDHHGLARIANLKNHDLGGIVSTYVLTHHHHTRDFRV